MRIRAAAYPRWVAAWGDVSWFVVFNGIADEWLWDFDADGFRLRHGDPAHRATGPPPAPNLLDDPEMADVREQISAELERRWLDDHIPALGGRTPREAALDPIGRHELERLLDSFDGGPGLMDVARLRQALGL